MALTAMKGFPRMDGMKVTSAVLLAAALAGCSKPVVVNLGQKPDGTPRSRIWLDRGAQKEAAREARAARQPAAAGQPVLLSPVPVTAPEVLQGPVTVGLRRDGACVVAGKQVRDEEVAARLGYVREERTKAGSQDLAIVTVLAEPQVEMDRVMRAMSAGHHAGFTKIGWQLVEQVALPAPEAMAATLPADEGRLVVAVGREGALRLGTEVLEPAALGVRLGEAAASRKAQSLPAPAVTVLADRDAPLASVKAVLGACEAAGIENVAFGSPVQVAVASPAALEDVEPEGSLISEAYRNWKLGLEGRDVDYSEGPPAYWYDQLFHAWLDESSMMLDALGDRTLNTERVRFYGNRAAGRLDHMAYILEAVDAPRAAPLKSLAVDMRRRGQQVWDGQVSLELVRMAVREARGRVEKEFAPAGVRFPAGLKLAPPDAPKPDAPKEATP